MTEEAVTAPIGEGMVGETAPPAEAPAPVETPVEAPTVEAAPVPVPEPAEVDVSAFKFPEKFAGQLQAFAKNSGVTQEALTQLFEGYTTADTEVKAAAWAEMASKGQEYVASWGEQKDDNLEVVRQTLKRVDTDGTVSKMLNETGYGNHPAILKMFLEIGDTFKEGGFLESAGNPSAAPQTAAQRMFGSSHPTD